MSVAWKRAQARTDRRRIDPRRDSVHRPRPRPTPGEPRRPRPKGAPIAHRQNPQRDPHPMNALVDIVIPVYNEETDLERSVRRLHAYLRAPSRSRSGSRSRTTPAPTAPVDGAAAGRRAARRAGRAPAAEGPRPCAAGGLAGERRAGGRLHGRRPVDGPDALLPLVAPLLSGHSDVAIGSRLARGFAGRARAEARVHLALLQPASCAPSLRVRFRDAQCGFKAMRADAAGGCCRSVRGHAWFFDTELLVLAERAGLRIHEVPVDWVDDPDRRVDIARRRSPTSGRRASSVRLAGAPIRRSTRSGRRDRPPQFRQIKSFAAIGSCQHAGLVALYAAPRGPRRIAAPMRCALVSRRSATPRPTGASPSASRAATGSAASRRGARRVRRRPGDHDRLDRRSSTVAPRARPTASSGRRSSRANVLGDGRPVRAAADLDRPARRLPRARRVDRASRPDGATREYPYIAGPGRVPHNDRSRCNRASLEPARDHRVQPRERRPPRAPRPKRPRAARRPPGRARSASAARGRRVPLEPDGQRLRQHVLLGGGPGGVAELERLVLRLARRLGLHHRRQAAARRRWSWACRSGCSG